MSNTTANRQCDSTNAEEVFIMGEPKPRATFGAWRKQTVKCLGHNMVPASITPADREIVNSRQIKKVTNDECNPDPTD